jgi:hypothetical protein
MTNAAGAFQVIKTDKAGPPVGPYSQGIKAGGLSSWPGRDRSATGIVPGGIEAETGGPWKTSRRSWKRRLEPGLAVQTFVYMTD